MIITIIKMMKKLFEEIEIIDNVKDEDALGRNCEESLENYVYFDIGQMFGVILVDAFIALFESKKGYYRR